MRRLAPLLALAAAVAAPAAAVLTPAAAAPRPPVEDPPAASPRAPDADRRDAGPRVAGGVRKGPDEWARPAAVRLARDLGWPALRRVSLGRPATRGALERALKAVPPPETTTFQVLSARAVPGPSRAGITLAAARRAFVRALGLESERRALQSLRTEDGERIPVPRDAGSEILARELGLVPNIPEPLERLERGAAEPMRYADLVTMADAARRVDAWRLAGLARYRDIALPDMGPQQRRVVRAALSQVGTPYVWGGEWPTPRSPFGPQAVGGFDCSGLVWWAFSGPDDLRTSGLGDGLGWRTTADRIAFSRSAGKRVALGRTRAGDLIFFGPDGRRTKRGHISHVGIALGGGWMVHSSGSRGGVSISHLDEYWTAGAAFARRPPAFSTAPGRV